MGSWLSVLKHAEMGFFGRMDVLCFFFFVFTAVDFSIPSIDKCCTFAILGNGTISFWSTLEFMLEFSFCPRCSSLYE